MARPLAVPDATAGLAAEAGSLAVRGAGTGLSVRRALIAANLVAALALGGALAAQPREPDDAMTRALLGQIPELRALAVPNGWGLPEAWDAGGDGSVNGPDTAYAITTALALAAILDAGAETPADAELAERWARDFWSDGFYWYSERPDDAVFTANVSAMLAGVTLRFAAERPEWFDPLTRERAVAAIRRVVEEADPGPVWRYSAASDQPNDLIHHAYIAWGLETARPWADVPWTTNELFDSHNGLIDYVTNWPAGGGYVRAAFARCFLGWRVASVVSPGVPIDPARDEAHRSFATACSPR